MISKKILNYSIFQVILMFCFITGCILFSPSVAFLKVFVLIVFIWNVFSYVVCANKSFDLYLVFLVVFFVFLLGRVFLDILGQNNFAQTIWFTDYVFNIDTQFKILQLLIVSLLFMQFAALLVLLLYYKREELPKESSWKYKRIIKKIGLYLFYFALIPYIISIFQQIIFVLNYGYVNLFSSSTLIVNNPLLQLSDDILKFGIYLFLACYPTKKEIKVPLIIYFILLGITLFIGRRGVVFTEILCLIVYFSFRKDINLKFKTLIFSGITIITLSLLVGLYRSDSRFNIMDYNIVHMLNNFTFEQGGSSNVIGYTIVHEKEIEKDFGYLVDPILYPLKSSFIANLFGVKPAIRGQSIAVIRDRHSLSHTLSYTVNPKLYLDGNGLGTSFIAEFYIVGGISGVAVMSFAYIFLLLSFVFKYKYTIVGMVLLFYILPNVLFAPRAHPLDFVNFLFRPILFLLLLQMVFPVFVKKR